jgi:hypothetical protein
MQQTALIIAILCSLGATAGEPAEPPTVRIKNRVGPLWPWADLRRRGLDVAELSERDNAAWVYIKAINACQSPSEAVWGVWAGAVRGDWPEGPDAERLEQLLEANDQTIKLAIEASRMARCQLPYLGRAEEPLGLINAAALPGMRFVMDLLAVRAKYLASHGREDEAAEGAVALLRVACHLGRSVSVREGVVAMGGVQRAAWLLRDLAVRHALGQERLVETIRQLAEVVPGVPKMQRLVASDKSITVDSFEAMFPHSEPPQPGQRPGDAGGGWAGLKNRLVGLVVPDRLMKRQLLHMYGRLGGSAGQPAHESLWAKPYRQLMLVANTAMWNAIARKRVKELIGSAMFFDRAACELRMTRIVLAIQLYLARTGEPPEKLEAVAGELGGELPPDPYSGKDFVYRRRGGGWMLYSVGENYVDDGGKIAPGGGQFVLDVVYQFSPDEGVSGRQRPTTTDNRGETHPLPSEPLR